MIIGFRLANDGCRHSHGHIRRTENANEIPLFSLLYGGVQRDIEIG